MQFIQAHKNIFIGAGIIIVLFIAYSFIKPDPNIATPSVVSEAPIAELSASRDIIALLVDLKAIKIQKDFFSDPVFRSLQDFSTPVPDEPRGRANPFAPVGTEGKTPAASTR